MAPPFSFAANLIIYFWYLTDYIFKANNKLGAIKREDDIISIVLSAIGAVALILVLIYGVRATRVDPEDTIIGI